MAPISRDRFLKVMRNFPKANILVIGDIMLDRYLQGEADRLSVEAPVAIVREKTSRFVLGGAANTANNVASLGGKATLAGIIGDDENGQTVRKLCRQNKINDAGFVVDKRRPTTTKTRVMVQHHQLLRLDNEKTEPPSRSLESALINKIRKINDVHMVIISDYAKGVVSKKLVDFIIKRFGAEKIMADFRPAQSFLYKRVSLILPNVREAHDITGLKSVDNATAKKVIKKLAQMFSGLIVLKRGGQGMTVFDAKEKEMVHIPTRAREVFDVTGAGDTVAAVLGLALASGGTLRESVEIANHAAGIVVEMEGTAVPSLKKLKERITEEL